MFALCSGYADVFNWDYENGEGDAVNFFQIDCFSAYDTQEKLIKKISDIVGFSVKADCLSITTSDDTAFLTVSGLFTISILGDYEYCESPKDTDTLFEIQYTFSVKCFEFRPVKTLTDKLQAQGANLID